MLKWEGTENTTLWDTRCNFGVNFMPSSGHESLRAVGSCEVNFQSI